MINNYEDYKKEMQKLEEEDFLNNMTDDYGEWQSTSRNIALRRFQLQCEAKEKGII